MDDVTKPRGTPEDYREFVKQMEAAADDDRPGAVERRWRYVSLQRRGELAAELMDLTDEIARHTGHRSTQQKRLQLPDVQWQPPAGP